MGRQFKSRGELRSGERYASGALGPGLADKERMIRNHAKAAAVHQEASPSHGYSEVSPATKAAHANAATAHKTALDAWQRNDPVAPALSRKAESASNKVYYAEAKTDLASARKAGAGLMAAKPGTGSHALFQRAQAAAESDAAARAGAPKQRAGGMAGALGYSKQKLEQGARSQKIPTNDPFHGAALKKMAADSSSHDQRLEQARVHEKQSAEHFAASGSMVAQSRTVQQAAHAAAGRAHRAAGDAAVYAPHEYADRKKEAEDATAATKTHDHAGPMKPGSEQKAPMSADEHIAQREIHLAAAKEAMARFRPQAETAAHLEAAKLHEHAASHAAGNEPRGGYKEAAARAHEASAHAQNETASADRGQHTPATALAGLGLDKPPPQAHQWSAEGHLNMADEHKYAAKAAMNPHERDAHLGAAAAHKAAAAAAKPGNPDYYQHASNARQATADADHATNLRKTVTSGFVAGVQGKGSPGGHADLGHELGSKLVAAGMMKTGKVEQAKAMQTGPRGGIHYVTAGGTKIYRGKK